tara:strand:+ start:1682 stop:2224 length:543 start_codon:yes stop_codon:yes gene_type:complete
MTSSCGLYKRADIKDVPVNVDERVQKNIAEGKGVKFGKLGGGTNSGSFDFASSNELWRATLETLDFVPFTNASYSGGVLITDWFSTENANNNISRELKITVRFLSNEIRADGLEVNIHEKICESNKVGCNIKKIKTGLENEIKLAILKKATILEKTTIKKKVKERKKKTIWKGKDAKGKN